MVRTATKETQSEFYDGFLEKRMISYRVNGNRRIDLAKNLIVSQARPGDTILDVGCGIGLISEAVSAARKGVRVVAIDLSPANIDFARQTVRKPNIEFRALDVSEEYAALQKLAPGGYDLALLVDVIEHVPSEKREKLFVELGKLCKSSATLVLTYPSPEYQKYLAEQEPEELQPIDNVIEAHELLAEAQQGEWNLVKYSRVDVWKQGQYIHAVFQKSEALSKLEPTSSTILTKVFRGFKKLTLGEKRARYYRRRLLEKRG